MELRQLEYFSVVAVPLTNTAAAARLHVAQPALWKQVNDLERELGVSLFERIGRRVRITSAGRQLLERVDQILAAARGLSGVAGDLRAGRTGRIRIGCLAPHIVAFLARAVAGFRATHPSVNVEL